MDTKRLIIPKKTAVKIDYLLTHEPENADECMQENWKLATVDYDNDYKAEVVLKAPPYDPDPQASNIPMLWINVSRAGETFEYCTPVLGHVWGRWLTNRGLLVIEQDDVEEITVI